MPIPKMNVRKGEDQKFERIRKLGFWMPAKNLKKTLHFPNHRINYK